MMKKKKPVHKVVRNKAFTRCVLNRFNYAWGKDKIARLRTSYQWSRVTCKNCLRCKPKRSGR